MGYGHFCLLRLRTGSGKHELENQHCRRQSYVTPLFDLVYGFTFESDSSNVVCVDFVNGINNLSSGLVSIYPNPATYKVMVISDLPITSVELFNCTGQTPVSLRKLNEESITVHVSEVETKVYFIKFTTIEGNLIIKIFILRKY
jgi:hypothetical protein